MPFRSMFALAVVLLLAAPLPLAFLPAADAAPPFGIGDWVVTGKEVLVDQGVILDGNLIVENGGSLTLVNTTLMLMPGPRELRVRSGGELRVLSGSSVSSFDSTERDQYRAGFWVDSGARSEFRNSTFSSIGIIYRWVESTKMGGVCISSDTAVLDNCTFTGNYIGLTVFGAVSVTNCRFRENRWAGAVSYGANTVWSNCSFSHDFYGMVAYRGSIDLLDCSFNDNAIGAAADSTDARFSDCDFIHNVRTGLYVSPEQGLSPTPEASVVHVNDCRFEQNRRGIDGVFFYSDEGGRIWPLEHDLFLTNSDFRNNTDSGVRWDGFIPDSIPRRSSSTWSVTGKSEVLSSASHFKGDLSIGGRLSVRSSVLAIGGDGDGWHRIDVLPGGRLDIFENSTLKSATGKAFGLRCKPGSIFMLEDSILQGCGWDQAVMERAGPYIETDSATIVRSKIRQCPTALVFNASRGPRVESSELLGNVSALLLSGSSVLLQNCTLEAPSPNVCRLDGGSLLESVNSTIHPDRIELADSQSRVNLSWYLDVRAVWTDGRPVGGASVVIHDSAGAEIVNTTVDGQGHAADLVLRQATMTSGGSDIFTPHHVVCRQGPVSNATDLEMSASLAVRLVLTDTEPPSLSVTAPAPDERLRSRQVRLSGRAQDNLGIDTVTLAVDGFRRFVVYQDPLGAQWQVDWNFTVELPEGYHTLEAVAVDSGGLRAVRAFPFWVDILPPNVLITAPYNGYLTNYPELDVGGMVEAGASVSVNGVPARTAGNSFSAVAHLLEGDNLVSATAVDLAGNMNQSSIIVRLDTAPPALEVVFLPDSAAVRNSQLTISGAMEFGAAVTVNGRRVVLPGLAQNFTTFFFLAPGNNTVAVEAADAAGNVNSVLRRVVLDTTPPAFQVLYPPDGLLTNERSLGVVMMAEAGTIVSADDATYEVPGSPGQMVNFSITYALHEGLNVILLACQDAAGNTFRTGRLVTLDTTPPQLELQSPVDGNRTPRGSVYIVGRTDPDAFVLVNGERLEVGYGGAFFGELGLGAGRNRLVVRAQDALGNFREVALNVTRVPSAGDTHLVGSTGPDWPFLGVLAIAAGSAAGEGWWLWRRQSRRPPHPAPSTLRPFQPVNRGVP